MNTTEFLQKLGFSEMEANTFLIIYKYGPKPASSIASIAKIDRTYCYRIIEKFRSENLIHETIERGVKQFFVPNLEVLEELLEKKKKAVSKLNKEFKTIRVELEKETQQKSEFVPNIQIFEGNQVVERFFEDIRKTIKDRDLIQISFFASNTFSSQTERIVEFQDIYVNFLQSLQKNKIHIDGYIGKGILIMEELVKISDYGELQSILPGKDSTYGFIVGRTLYILQFKEISVGLKIDSLSMTDIFSFLLENLRIG